MPTRRQFLKWAGLSSLGAVAFKACSFAEREILVQSPLEIPEDQVKGRDAFFATTCKQCGAGCGVITRVIEGRAIKLEGNPNHPISRGKLCVRGQTGVQEVYHPDRIQTPLRRTGERGAGRFEPISWEAAEAELVNRLRGLGNRQALLITEPLRGRLAQITKQFVDATKADYASFDPMDQRSTLRAAMRELFDQDQLPEFDLENTRFLLGFGVDMFETWISMVRHSRGYGEFRQGEGRERGTFVQVDSRFSMTAANADKWVPIKPGMEGLLALSMAYTIVREGLGDAAAANAMTGGGGYQALEAFAPEKVGSEIGVEEREIIRLARSFASERPSLAIGGNSAGAHTNGTFNLMAIYSLNALVGSIGSRGGLYFNPEPLSPGRGNALPITAFGEWQQKVERIRNGDVEVLMVHGADPVHGSPRSTRFPQGLGRVDFIVSFNSFVDDTTAYADLVLPDNLYLESWGDDVPEPGPGYEAVTFQQPVMRPFYNTRAFGDELIKIGKELGGNFPWNSVKDAVRETAQLLHQRDRGSLRAATFEAFWNGVLQRGVWYDLDSRPDSKTLPKSLPREFIQPAFAEGPVGGANFHLIVYQSNSLVDGRLAHLPWLQAAPDPITTVTWDSWVDMSLEDAKRLGVKLNDIVEVRSAQGAIEAPVYPNRGTPPGIISVAAGQGHRNFGRYAEGRGSNVLSILAPFTDGHTGTLAWNATKVRVSKVNRQRTLPKFEGSVPALPAPETELVQIEHKG